LRFDVKPLIGLLEAGIAERLFPGGAFAVGGKGWVETGCAGKLTYEPDAAAVDQTTLYDLASLTKVVGTTSAAMLLVDDGLLKLDDPVQRYVKDFAGVEKDKVTIRDLLLHQSGLPAYKSLVGKVTRPEETKSNLMASSLNYSTGAKCEYSCVGFITLQQVIEARSEKPLDVFLQERLFGPLGMTDTAFLQPKYRRARIAPTELDADWRDPFRRAGFVRQTYNQGEVHDPLALMMGGVSGNAGLFASVADLSKFCQLYLNHGATKGAQILCADSIAAWTRKQSALSTRGFGWDTKSATGSSAGNLFSEVSFGHTGYTGTTIWIDPKRELFAVLLTNRVHPNDKASLADFRPKFHDAVIMSLRPN
jgi:CubicO group peptidase (beta-lactamase class C family)